MTTREFDLVSRLDHNAEAGGGRVALIFATEQITFTELAQRSLAVARALAAAGVGTGDRVVHVATDTPALYELLYGCARIGAVLVPVNWRMATDELDFVVKHSGARVLITDRPDLAAENVVQLGDFARWRDSATTWPHGEGALAGARVRTHARTHARVVLRATLSRRPTIFTDATLAEGTCPCGQAEVSGPRRWPALGDADRIVLQREPGCRKAKGARPSPA